MNKAESKYFNTAVRFNKALLSLLEKKPFEYITIREICEKAEVNRSHLHLRKRVINSALTNSDFFQKGIDSHAPS